MKRNIRDYEILVTPKNFFYKNDIQHSSNDLLLSEYKNSKKSNLEKNQSFIVTPKNSKIIKRQISSHLGKSKINKFCSPRKKKNDLILEEDFQKESSLIQSFIAKTKIRKSLTKKILINQMKKYEDQLRFKKLEKENQKTLRVQGYNYDHSKIQSQEKKNTIIHKKNKEEKTKPLQCVTRNSEPQKLKKSKNEQFLKFFVESVQIKYENGVQSYKALMNFNDSSRSKKKKDRPTTSSAYLSKKKTLKCLKSGKYCGKQHNTARPDYRSYHLEKKSDAIDEKKLFFLTCNK